MMNLSRTVGYALQATLQLAQADSEHPIPCSRLAAEGQMPERFLLQILRSLVTHGILSSTRGVEGGYMLTKPAAEVSILDVIEAVEGPIDNPLQLAQGLPESSQHRLRDALSDVAQMARDQLRAIKLTHLLLPMHGGRSKESENASSTNDAHTHANGPLPAPHGAMHMPTVRGEA